MIESLIHRDPAIRVVYSTGELMRSIEADIRIGFYQEHGRCPKFSQTIPEYHFDKATH